MENNVRRKTAEYRRKEKKRIFMLTSNDNYAISANKQSLFITTHQGTAAKGGTDNL